MDLLREKLKARGAMCAVLRGGDSSESTTTQGATTTTTNTDRRQAIQDGVGINGEGNTYTSDSRDMSVNVINSSDAVIAMADMGADVIKSSGASVVDLYKDAGKRNTEAWNVTLTQGAKLVDKLIDKVGDGFSLSEKVINSFQPNENKNSDAIKTAAIAAGVIGVALMFGKKS